MKKAYARTRKSTCSQLAARLLTATLLIGNLLSIAALPAQAMQSDESEVPIAIEDAKPSAGNPDTDTYGDFGEDSARPDDMSESALRDDAHDTQLQPDGAADQGAGLTLGTVAEVPRAASQQNRTFGGGDTIDNYGELLAALSSVMADAMVDEAILLIGSSFEVEAPIAIERKTITLRGAGDDIVLTSGAGARHFSLSGAGRLIIERLTLDGGADGGGVYLRNGHFTLERDAVIRNSHNDTGGAVHVQQPGDTATIRGRITGCTATNGGGIYSNSTVGIHLEGATLSGNRADQSGGAIYAIVASSEGATIADNTAQSGGGIHISVSTNLAGSRFTATDTTISGNRALVDHDIYSGGGGIFMAQGASITLTGGAVSDNMSHSVGGGVFVRSGGEVYLSDVTVTDNRATGSGGGIAVHYSLTKTPTVLTIDGGRFDRNTAGDYGGAISWYAGGTDDDRFTLTGANFANNVAYAGGAVRIHWPTLSGGSPITVPDIIRSCTFADNRASGDEHGNGDGGGAILMSGIGNPLIDDCTFTDNTAAGGDGGGVRATSSGKLILTGSTFTGNRSLHWLGGAVAAVSGAELDDVTATGNTAFFGGGLYLEGRVFANRLDIRDNGAAYDGSGLYIGGPDAALALENSLIIGNRSGRNGGGIFIGEPAKLSATDVVFGDNTAADGAYFITDPADLDLYNQRITYQNIPVPESFSGGIPHALNNLDISYTRGAKAHAVTFDANGGHFLGGQTTRKVWVRSGNTVSEPPITQWPQSPHATFSGWYTTAQGDIKWDFSAAIAGDATLYAGWGQDFIGVDVSLRIEHHQFDSTVDIDRAVKVAEEFAFAARGDSIDLTDRVRTYDDYTFNKTVSDPLEYDVVDYGMSVRLYYQKNVDPGEGDPGTGDPGEGNQGEGDPGGGRRPSRPGEYADGDTQEPSLAGGVETGERISSRSAHPPIIQGDIEVLPYTGPTKRSARIWPVGAGCLMAYVWRKTAAHMAM